MIRAIIFDCFGVLTTDGWLPFKKKHFGHDQQLEQQATDSNKQVDAGLSSFEDHIRELAKLAHISREQVWAAIHDNVPNDELFAYIERDLKPHYMIGLLSNTGSDRLLELFSAEHVALFDATALSYDTGFVKPDPRAYAIIAERLGVQPEECVFIDDQERFCTAARDEGMQAIVYRNYEQLRAELTELLASDEA